MSSNPLVTVAAPGWDARTAPDWALVYSNQWPSLTIGYETTIQGPTMSAVSFTHGLPFPPLTTGYMISDNISYGRVGAGSFTVSPQTGMMSLRLLPNQSITICCYPIDISKDVSYTFPQTASTKFASDLSTSIKVAKTGRNIGSQNLNDFVLNSQAQSPAVLTVATQDGHYYSTDATISENAIVIPLRTQYVPWVVGTFLVSVSNKTYQFFNINGLEVLESNLILDLGDNIGGSLIVLRDPLFYPNTVRLVY